jgi:hypothetical protein
MWTLVLIVVVSTPANTGGVATSTSFLDFPDQAKCQSAAAALAVPDFLKLPTGPNPTPSAIYRVTAKCVGR